MLDDAPKSSLCRVLASLVVSNAKFVKPLLNRRISIDVIALRLSRHQISGIRRIFGTSPWECAMLSLAWDPGFKT